MKFFHRKEKVEETVTFDEQQFVIEWLRNMSKQDYNKTLKIVDIYREADEKVKIIEFGSKKAVQTQEQETEEFSESFLEV